MHTLRQKSACVLISLSLVGIAGCNRSNQSNQSKQIQPKLVAQAPITKIAPPTPIQKKKEELGGTTWDPQWDRFIERSLPPAMLSTRVPRDVRHFCPRFYQLSDVDKRTFWAYFFQALAGAEAGLDPSTNVRHTEPEVAKVDSVSHQMVRSEGLLQLTYEDRRRYGCDFDWNKDKNLSTKNPAKTILRPENNLKCGIKILVSQIIVHHKPLLSPSGYWSTLHPGTPDYLVFSKQMTNPPAACGRGDTDTKSLESDRQIARVNSQGEAQQHSAAQLSSK
jgi:hypothetical protein